MSQNGYGNRTGEQNGHYQVALVGMLFAYSVRCLQCPDTVVKCAFWLYVGNSASTPVPATRNCAVDYCIAASIGVTDVRVQ